MKRTNVAAGFALAATALLAAAPAFAQFAKPEAAIEYRQAAMTLMGAHMGRIAPMVKGEKPYDAAAAQSNAAIIQMLSKLPFDAFLPGTDKGKTKAKPEIWKQPDKFHADAQDMQKAVDELAAATRTGGLDQVRGAFGKVAKACKSCHDDFRAH